MKKIALLAALALALFGTAQTASAQFDIGAHVGYNLDAVGTDGDEGQAFVGASARFYPGVLPVAISPAVDVYFVEDVTFLQFDLNGLYEIGRGTTTAFTPYVGAGLGLIYTNVDIGDESESNTETGLNLLAGATFELPRLRPFAQARMTIADGTAVSVTGGVLFRLGN